ncbi:MAG: acyltransferase domain-containing protein [Proteobacteria bacterium]|nr:acyltransferase domain-containing protein [Pseudomonadota bacterium]
MSKVVASLLHIKGGCARDFGVKNRVFVFPGQGSQVVGMGGAFAATQGGRELLEEADDVLGFGLSRLMAEGPLEELTLTQNAQPALLVAGMLAFNHLIKCVNKPLSEVAGYVAGHSLGEYTAVCAAGGMDFATALGCVRLRGQEMAAVRGGAMAAVLGLGSQDLRVSGSQAGGWVLANDNCPGQVVFSGPEEGFVAFEAAAKDAGAKRVLRLNVSGAFHTAGMRPAGEKVGEYLGFKGLKELVVPCVMNATAVAEREAEKVRAGLVAQVSSRVRWREGMMLVAEEGTRNEERGSEGKVEVVELGVGKVLAGLAGRCDGRLVGVSLEAPGEVEEWLRQVGY